MDEIKAVIKALKESLDTQERDYSEQWKEAGLKGNLVIPLFKSFLGYDPLKDMAFEFKLPSTGGEFLDILLQDSLVIEVKRFNLLSDEPKRKKAIKEIRRYLAPEDNVYFGILTDGVVWEFFMERLFMERYGNDGEKIPSIRDPIPLCFRLNSFDDDFLDSIHIFHSSGFFRNMKLLARCIVNRAMKKPGGVAWHNLFAPLDNAQRQKTCGDKLKKKIEDIFTPETGEFIDKIRAGEYHEGAKLQWGDEFIRLGITLEPNGAIKVDMSNTFMKPEKQHEVLKKYPNIIEKLFKTWLQDEKDRIYGSRIELLKNITGKKAIFSKDKFLDAWTRV